MTELSETIDEIEAIGDDIADQRDTCLKLVNETQSDRDTCKGALKEVEKARDILQVKVSDYEKVIAKQDARVKPFVWFSAGIASTVVAGLAVLFAVTAL